MTTSVAWMSGCDGGANSDSSGPWAEAAQPAPSTDRIEASIRAAEDYLNAENLVAAEAILARLIERVPNEPRALELHGHVLLARGAEAREEGRHDEALKHFDRAYERYRDLLQLTPQSAGLHQSAGELAQMLGRMDEAIWHYEASHDLQPRDVKPLLLAAQIHLEQHRNEEAERRLMQVLALDADEPLAHASLATLRSRQDRMDEALEHVRRARRIDPEAVAFRVLEASILRRAGRAEEGLQMLVALPERQRLRHDVASEIARGYLAIDRPRDAARTWAFVYQSRPHDRHAWRAAVEAGQAMLLADEWQMATTWLAEARRAGGDQPEILALEASIDEVRSSSR